MPRKAGQAAVKRKERASEAQELRRVQVELVRLSARDRGAERWYRTVVALGLDEPVVERGGGVDLPAAAPTTRQVKKISPPEPISAGNRPTTSDSPRQTPRSE